MATEILELDEINLSQANKEISHNTALRQIEGRTIGVLSRTTTTPPGSPAAGDCYIIPASATGEWSGKTDQLAHFYGGVWNYWTPNAPVRLWVADDQVITLWDGAAWVDLISPSLIPPFVDTTAIVKGSSDSTKKVRLEVDGLTTATTRVATVPNKSFTIAGTDDAAAAQAAAEATAAAALSSHAGAADPHTGYQKESEKSAANGYASLDSGGKVPAGELPALRNLVMEQICFGFTTDVAVGDGQGYMVVPSPMNGLNLVRVHARVITAGTTGTTDIQIHNVTQGADMLSTKITIDSTETGSDTAATPAVIDTGNDDVATNDLLRVDLDAVSTTAPKGLLVTLEFA